MKLPENWNELKPGVRDYVLRRICQEEQLKTFVWVMTCVLTVGAIYGILELVAWLQKGATS